MRRTTIAALAATTMLAAPAAAQAHVTLQPEQAPAGGFTRLDVRVPNEEPDKGTTKVQVQMPPGFAFVSYEPVPGWKVDVKKEKLRKPISAGHGEKITEQVSQVTWTGDGKQGIVRPGQFQDFGLSVGVPKGKVGSKLTFKALQTYQGGKVVRWIGPPDAEKPAAQVTLTKDEEHGAAAAPARASAPAASSGDDGPSTGLVVVALVLGAVGVATGGAALARGRGRAT